MSTPHDLKNAGLKATLPRLKIINVFEHSKVRHLTAEDVYKQLLGDGLDVGLATVYRVLTQFEQAGLLVRHHFESGKAVFELNEGGHHDHLVARPEAVELDDESLLALLETDSRQTILKLAAQRSSSH